MKEMNLGDLVIRGESDGAMPMNISIVVGVSEGGAMVQYLSRRVASQDPKWEKYQMYPVDQLIPVKDFGVHVELKFNGDGEPFLKCAQSRGSVVTYRDGLPRPWTNGPYACVLSDRMLGLFTRLRATRSEVKE